MEPARRAEQYVLAAAGAAVLVLAIALVTAARVPVPDYALASTILAAGALAASYVALQFWGFKFEWRGHWLTANLDEAVVFLAILWLPGPAALFLIPAAEVVVHFVSRRKPLKGIFNIAQLVLSTAVAWDAAALARNAGAPPLMAAALGVPLYVLASNLLLAGVFARLEGERVLRVYAQRLAPTTILLSALGLSGGLMVYALASVHPVALLALAPFVFAIRRNAVLASRGDRELAVHRQLAEASTSLVRAFDLEPVADFTLTHVGSTVPAGRATLRLDGGHSWSRDYEAGPDDRARTTRVPLPGPNGEPIGLLEVTPRLGRRGLDDAEKALLAVLAGQAAAAFLSARAHEEALAQQQRLAKQEKLSALGTLVANVAHEIGNPLSYMRLSLATAQKQAEAMPDSEKLQRSIATARKGVENVVGISNSLRSVARQGPDGTRPADLNQVARDVASVVSVGFARSIALDLDLAPGELMVNGNAGQLTQIAMNLAKNAAEAIGERGGRVLLRTRARGDRAILVVEDDGPGIPPEVAKRLFQAFFTTKADGTGIGLNVSRDLARAHGGDLTFATGERGTSFSLDLPALAATPPVAERGTPEMRSP